jgi:hypothetical protein
LRERSRRSCSSPKWIMSAMTSATLAMAHGDVLHLAHFADLRMNETRIADPTDEERARTKLLRLGSSTGT